MRHLRRIRDHEIPHSPIAEKDEYVIRSAINGKILCTATGRRLYAIGRDAVETVRQYCEENAIDIMIRNMEADERFIQDERNRNWMDEVNA
jgi:hypothetical protein